MGAEVEAAQPDDALLLAGCDPVEVVFHPRGEVVVDEAAEVLLEQADDRERDKRRDERRSLLEHVAALEDRAQDRGVRRRPADAELLERLDERRLREPRRRARRVAERLELLERERVALGELGQTPLDAVSIAVLVVSAFLVGGE